MPGRERMGMKKRYTVSIEGKADKAVGKIDSPDHERIDEKIKGLADNPRPRGTLKIGPKTYRIIVGQYRVIFVIDDMERRVEVFKVSTREGAY
jgi:mRNA interferase RelE/StbE